MSRRTPPRRARSFSSTTTGIARGRGPTASSAAAAHGFARAPARRATSPPARRSRSGARTARNGSPRSGARCSKASSSSRSTTARRPTSCCKVAGIVDAKAILVGDAVDVDAARTAAAGLEARRDLPAKRRKPRRATTEAPDLRPPTVDHDDHRRNHLHLRRHGRAEGRRPHAQEHPRQHRPDRARDGEVPQSTRGPFRPIRFLNLLPLSHMFGQAMATFVPPMLPGVVVFTRSYAPDDIVRQIKRAADLGAGVRAEDPRGPARPHPPRRAGSGGAAARRACTGRSGGGTTAGSTGCSASSSGRWSSARRRSIPSSRRSGAGSGFVVVQGYGLTETAPIVTLNHPLHAKRGAVGKPIAGVEIKIARGRRDPRARRERDDRLLQRARSDARGVRRTAGSTPATSASSTPKGGCSSRAARRK